LRIGAGGVEGVYRSESDSVKWEGEVVERIGKGKVIPAQDQILQIPKRRSQPARYKYYICMSDSPTREIT